MARKNAVKEMTKVLSEVLEEVPTKLTEKELLERGQELAKVEEDIHVLGEKEAGFKATLKAERMDLERDRARLAAAIRAKQEPREVTVRTVANYPDGEIERWRTDTDEIISRRKMKPHERQLTAFDPAAVPENGATTEAPDELRF